MGHVYVTTAEWDDYVEGTTLAVGSRGLTRFERTAERDLPKLVLPALLPDLHAEMLAEAVPVATIGPAEAVYLYQPGDGPQGEDVWELCCVSPIVELDEDTAPIPVPVARGVVDEADSGVDD